MNDQNIKKRRVLRKLKTDRVMRSLLDAFPVIECNVKAHDFTRGNLTEIIYIERGWRTVVAKRAKKMAFVAVLNQDSDFYEYVDNLWRLCPCIIGLRFTILLPPELVLRMQVFKNKHHQCEHCVNWRNIAKDTLWMRKLIHAKPACNILSNLRLFS